MSSSDVKYDRLDITDWFHSLPHYGVDLRTIKNSYFDPRNEDYVKSLVVFVALPIAVMIAILLLYLLATIIMCCCCTDGKKRSNVRTDCKVIIFLFGLIGGLSFAVGLYGDWSLHQGIKSVKGSSEDAVDWFNDIQNDTRVATGLLDVSKNIKSLQDIMNSLATGQPAVEQQLKTFLDASAAISSSFKKSNEEVLSANKTINNDNTSRVVNQVPGDIEKYGRIFCISVLAVLLVLAIIGIVFVCAICSRCLLGCWTVLTVIAFILCCIILGTSFGASVGGSDFCLNATAWIRSEIGNKDISDYLECTGISNVISDNLATADTALKEAQKTTNDLKSLSEKVNQICDQFRPPACTPGIGAQIDKDVTEINRSVGRALELVDHFKTIADCKRINKDMNDSLTSICTDGIKGLVLMFFNSIASSFCFAVLIFSATFALK